MDKKSRVCIYGMGITACLFVLFVGAVILAAKILPYFLKAAEELGF